MFIKSLLAGALVAGAVLVGGSPPTSAQELEADLLPGDVRFDVLDGCDSVRATNTSDTDVYLTVEALDQFGNPNWSFPFTAGETVEFSMPDDIGSASPLQVAPGYFLPSAGDGRCSAVVWQPDGLGSDVLAVFDLWYGHPYGWALDTECVGGDQLVTLTNTGSADLYFRVEGPYWGNLHHVAPGESDSEIAGNLTDPGILVGVRTNPDFTGDPDAGGSGFVNELNCVPPVPKCAGRPATIVGTAKADTLRGTPGRDVIVAKGGADVIRGRGGNDVICAGNGNDKVYGDDGKDQVFGQGGRDSILGGKHADVLNGGLGRDVCNGGTGKDRAIKCEVRRNIP